MSQNYRPRTSVLWARRVIALAVLGGIIWGLYAGISAGISYVGGLFNSDKAPFLTEGDNCEPQQIKVEAFVGTKDKTNQLAFNAGDKPYFWFSITNTASVKCKFNVGSSATFYKVTSGSDNIYNSQDCILETERTDLIMLLNPNQAVSSDADYWERVRSSNQGCSAADGLPEVSAGGASYFLEAEVNGVISENTQQFVLN